jgi:hypothetical protein
LVDQCGVVNHGRLDQGRLDRARTIVQSRRLSHGSRDLRQAEGVLSQSERFHLILGRHLGMSDQVGDVRNGSETGVKRE